MAVNPTDDARERRAAAARVSRDFAIVDDLDLLLAVANHGFAVLFDGFSTIQLGDGPDSRYVSDGMPVLYEQLSQDVAAGVAGEPHPDAVNSRPGILLVPQCGTVPCRAWIQFDSPHPVNAEQMIVADLLAQAFALAVDRVVTQDGAARREDQWTAAIHNQQIVGQAIGILVERHRIRPDEAFNRLRAASQHRNIKLREIAHRILETGQEPEHA